MCESVLEDGGLAEDGQDWQTIFCRLDLQDGRVDGRICRRSLLAWLATLSLQESLALEVRQGQGRERMLQLVRMVDTDQDGYISREEFLALVQEEGRHLEELEARPLLRYLRVAAYADHYRWWPPPLFSLLLCLVLLAVFLHQALLLGTTAYPACSPLALHPAYSHQPWRLVTYGLAHHGLSHLAVNLALVLVVGLPLEMSHGWARVALVYLVGVLAASLTYSLAKPCGVLVGCSGGVYALTTAHLATILLNWREDSLVLRQRLRNKQATAPTFGVIIRLCRIVMVSGLLMVDVIDSLILSASQTSYTAHLTGSAVGLLVGLVVLRNRRVEHWETWLKMACCGLAAVLVGAVAVAVVVQGDRLGECHRRGARVCLCQSFTDCQQSN